MNGIVLWYKSDKQLGLVWCEDQGPLACITSNTELLTGVGGFESGDQIVFHTDKEGPMREISRVVSCRRGSGDIDPHQLLANEDAVVIHSLSDVTHLKVVA